MITNGRGGMRWRKNGRGLDKITDYVVVRVINHRQPTTIAADAPLLKVRSLLNSLLLLLLRKVIKSQSQGNFLV